MLRPAVICNSAGWLLQLLANDEGDVGTWLPADKHCLQCYVRVYNTACPTTCSTHPVYHRAYAILAETLLGQSDAHFQECRGMALRGQQPANHSSTDCSLFDLVYLTSIKPHAKHRIESSNKLSATPGGGLRNVEHGSRVQL